jgi:hypothetical protein
MQNVKFAAKKISSIFWRQFVNFRRISNLSKCTLTFGETGWLDRSEGMQELTKGLDGGGRVKNEEKLG